MLCYVIAAKNVLPFQKGKKLKHTQKLLCVDVKTIAGGSYYGVALAIGNTTIVASQVRSVALTYSCPKQLIGLEHRLAVVESVSHQETQMELWSSVD